MLMPSQKAVQIAQPGRNLESISAAAPSEGSQGGRLTMASTRTPKPARAAVEHVPPKGESEAGGRAASSLLF